VPHDLCEKCLRPWSITGKRPCEQMYGRLLDPTEDIAVEYEENGTPCLEIVSTGCPQDMRWERPELVVGEVQGWQTANHDREVSTEDEKHNMVWKVVESCMPHDCCEKCFWLWSTADTQLYEEEYCGLQDLAVDTTAGCGEDGVLCVEHVSTGFSQVMRLRDVSCLSSCCSACKN